MRNRGTIRAGVEKNQLDEQVQWTYWEQEGSDLDIHSEGTEQQRASRPRCGFWALPIRDLLRFVASKISTLAVSLALTTAPVTSTSTLPSLTSCVLRNTSGASCSLLLKR
jgi:hypothetical protein